MRRVLAMIMAGGQGERLSILSQERAKPAVPFGGKYRLIDFTLSNCVNSGIYKVAVLAQYRPRSLIDHIGIGKPWDLDRQDGGVRISQPHLGRKGILWYSGSADAVYQNAFYIEEQKADVVLVLSGDHVYKMDYVKMLDYHVQSGADVTVAVNEVPLEQAYRFGIVTLNQGGEVTDFVEKPQHPQSNLVSMGVYVFNKDVLLARLEADAANRTSAHDFGRNVIPSMMGRDRVFGYVFKGYWRDVGTVHSYWEAHMDLLEIPPRFNLYDDWVVHTKSQEEPPAFLGGTAQVTRSLVSHGCIIDGCVEHSVLSPGVRVARGAVVRDSIVMFDTTIGPGSVVERCILDKEVTVGENCYLGYGDDYTPNSEEPGRLNTGITLIGKRVVIPDGVRIGRNCKICPNVASGHFRSTEVASGTTIDVVAPHAMREITA